MRQGVKLQGRGVRARRLAAFVAAVACGCALSTSCSSSTNGPVNGTSCQVNGDCASGCCLPGGYPTDPTSPARVCTEPNGCVGYDGSPGPSSSPPPDSGGG